MTYQRIKLPYELNELEPIVYFETMYYHYEILHKNYELKLTETLRAGTGSALIKQFPTLEKLLENLLSLPVELQDEVRFFGGGLLNHNFFFLHLTTMDQHSEANISQELLGVINQEFTNLANLKKKLVESALKIRGSG